jgi:hypothetical protein
MDLDFTASDQDILDKLKVFNEEVFLIFILRNIRQTNQSLIFLKTDILMCLITNILVIQVSCKLSQQTRT